MPSHRLRCIVLVIRLTASLTLIVVWIICNPYLNTGRGFMLNLPLRALRLTC